MTGTVARVVLDGAAYSFDKPYTYSVPPELRDTALAGCRVLIPFSRSNFKKQGMIISLQNGETDELKAIISVTDDKPVLNDEMLLMCEWMHEHIFCTYFDAIHAMLPAGINYKLTDYYSGNPEFSSTEMLTEAEKTVVSYLCSKGETSAEKIIKNCEADENLLSTLVLKEAVFKNSSPIRKMNDATQKWVRLAVDADELDSYSLTKKQREISGIIADTGSTSVKELRYFTGVTMSVINALSEKRIITLFEKEVFRTPYRYGKAVNRSEIILTDEQQKAFDEMELKLLSEKGETSLLYGVTGSGKTQVFLKLVDKVSDSGLGVIVMVPEIALTPQIINIFSSRYGNKIAVFHSAMSAGQRMDEWKRIKNGEALIAIGTRSAVFAPFKKLGLIIIDEEQEHTYKSEKSPRFHARELAKFRNAYHKRLLCLASATPSVESYCAALNKKYALSKITQRYGNAVLPEVITVDMRKEILSGNSSSISSRLNQEITAALENKKQIILLLNRRGHNTYIACPGCGYIATCPNCSISLTYHSANGRLMCHYCGYSEVAAKKCPDCGSEHIRFMGIGTQKVAEELNMLFPKAKILRVDADSTMSRESFSTYLNDFASGKYDIMLGTQMVAKGLDFPNVTLVGVLGADQAMYSEDYRSFERTFSLLTQVVGRAGRGENPGRAVIQTVNPDSNIIELARQQNYDDFYKDEILSRKLMIYPPYCDICVVCVQSEDRSLAENAINGIFGKIKEILNTDYTDVKLIILGPAAASMPKVNNRYRFRMIIKCKNNKKFRDMLREAINIKLARDISVLVDINPESII